MSKTNYILIVLLTLTNLSIGQSIESIFEKEYSDFNANPNLEKLEDSINVKLNSLDKVLKYGENSSQANLILFQSRIFELSEKHFTDKKGLILTWGTNGNCGRYGEWFDEITSKFGFKYASVNCSCIVGNIPELVESYNKYSTEYLNTKYGKDWLKKIENEILTKKRKIEFDYTEEEIKKLTELHLEARELIEYPKKIEQFYNLEILYFNINNLTEIDESICQLKKLKTLGLHSNKFREFPKEITCLENLKYLGIDLNELKSIPSEIGKLRKLEKLVISQNKIKELPIEFCELENLEWFDIRENELSDLPKGFENLKNLKTLILWENKFETIPSSVYKMKELEKISIKWGNNISEEEISELQKALPNTKIK